MKNPYVEAIQVIDLAFDHFNETLCLGSLKKPIINILSRGTKKCLGWHWKDKWKVQEEPATEITIVAESLNRPMEEILETLLHEMVHLYNTQAGVSDCNAQQRHNKHFRKTATEVFFLQVDKHPTKGWAITSLTDKSRSLVQSWLTEKQVQPIKMVRVSNKIKETKSAKTYMISVSEADYLVLKEKSRETGMSMKETVSSLLEQFVENSEEKVA